MNEKSMAISICRLLKLLILFFVFPSTSSATSSTFDNQAAYADHCASIVPQSAPKGGLQGRHYGQQHTGYCTGGNGMLGPHPSNQVIDFRTWTLRETYAQGIFKLQGSIRIRFPRASAYEYVGNSTSSRYKSYPQRSRAIYFAVDGFWSQSSGKLCMIGDGYGYSKGGSYLHKIQYILKLYNFFNSSSITSLISGTLESLSSSDDFKFGPVSILVFPRMNYQYTLLSNNSGNSSTSGGSDDLPPTSSLKMERFCSVLTREVLNHEFDLKYSSRCASAKNCTPLAVPGMPRHVSLKDIECSEDKRSLRVLVKFSDSHRSNVWYRRPFNPNTTMVGEGSWEENRSQLSVVACQLLDAAGSWNNTRVGDCSTRLSLGFPAIWTIGNTSSIVGNIWTKKTVIESGYFENITFESPQGDFTRVLIPGLKYEYTKIEEVTKLCLRKKSARGKTYMYPSPFSYDMRFDISAKNSKGHVAWGSSEPLSVGNQFYHTYYSKQAVNTDASTEEVLAPGIESYRNNHRNPYNISYKISIGLPSNGKWGNVSISNEMQISAEGIYDATEGSLCMVGCRNLGSKIQQTTNDYVDCEISVNFQFPPENPNKNSGYIKGSIKSTRKKYDPLHFESWDLSAASGYIIEERRSIWWMDVEITLVLMSTTLACVFVALQLFHVKKHPDVLPSISIFMLLILTLVYMIPLMLNFDAMFKNRTNRRSVFLGSGGWLEVNEEIVRVITMVAFMLQIRLLQLAWSARSENGTEKELWIMEKKALLVTIPVYVVGALAALFLIIWRKTDTNPHVVVISTYQEHPILGIALKSYAGLVLDVFLLPQILLNMFCKSKDKALSVSFYMGTTFVRVLPHAYDLYRANSSAYRQLHESYLYASPVADFYSTAWDVIIPFGGSLFAGIIYLQQKYGGLCILPQKLRELSAYEKIPTATVTEG